MAESIIKKTGTSTLVTWEDTMQTKINRIDRFLRLASMAGALTLGLTLAACGGDAVQNRANDFSPGGPSDPSGPTTVRIGKGHGSGFVAGQIEVGIGDTALAAGGSTMLTINLVNSDGDLVTDNIEVTYNSPCIAAGESLLSPPLGVVDEEFTNTVTSNNGQASLMYRANGCIGSDTVTATASHDGRVLTARATLEIAADTVESLSFVSASPEIISLRGTGGNETSTVVFEVRGEAGAPIKDVEIQFSLNTSVGGLSLLNTSAVTGTNGRASTTVRSGTVATPAQVTATVNLPGGTISVQSRGPVVSTGLPDQNSMSLAASDLYPASWNTDGVLSELTIRMADAFNNPVPDGTPVSFTTSGGSIQPNCSTVGGQCTVEWRSQNPRPMGRPGELVIDESTLSLSCSGGTECRAGRVAILATAVGNESFIDTTGTGRYDGPPDIFATAGNCSANVPASSAQVGAAGCDDLGEAYLDKNFNGVRDADEEFVDFNQNGVHDGGNGIYDGILCSDSALAAGLCTRNTVTVRDDIRLVMSCHRPLTMPDGRLPGQPTNISLAPGQIRLITMLLADCNGNGMPAGTEISASTSQAVNVDASAGPEQLPGSAEPTYISLFLEADDSDPAGGVVWVQVSSGGVTRNFPIVIN